MFVVHRSLYFWASLQAGLICLAPSCVEPGDGNSAAVPPADNSNTNPDSQNRYIPPDASGGAADTEPEIMTDPPLGPTPSGGKCDYVAIPQESGKAFGEGCEKNAECAWGECLEPVEGGNITNEVFGFCTRACDCGTTETQLTPEQKPDLMCIYPPGNERKWSHVVVRCNSLADCTALDARWTACRLPIAGGLQAVCHADNP